MLAINFTIGLGIGLFMGAGFVADTWLGAIPWFTITGTLVSATLSFLDVYTQLERCRRKGTSRPS